MLKSKLSAFLSLLLVFFSGAVLGAFTHRLYMVKVVSSNSGGPTTARGRPDPEEIRKHVVEEMRGIAKLDDQQVVKLNQIYDHTREQSDQVRKQANAGMRAVWDNQTEQIRAILRPDQLALFNAWHERREQERKMHRKEGPPPPGEHRPPDEHR
ncbi:MAG TPA: hypothetical protein VE959_19935 [Bryobacteraceae bacterium]|nr:hypothetical protein [Bryobacteraceae bacterium]